LPFPAKNLSYNDIYISISLKNTNNLYKNKGISVGNREVISQTEKIQLYHTQRILEFCIAQIPNQNKEEGTEF